MLRASLVAGLVGVLGTWVGLIRLKRSGSRRPAEVYWLLGLGAMFPAWLIAFLGLLGRIAGRFPERSLAAWWILSSAAAVLSVILADAAVRRLRASGEAHRPATYWLVGVATFCPAWAIALAGLLRT